MSYSQIYRTPQKLDSTCSAVLSVRFCSCVHGLDPGIMCPMSHRGSNHDVFAWCKRNTDKMQTRSHFYIGQFNYEKHVTPVSSRACPGTFTITFSATLLSKIELIVCTSDLVDNMACGKKYYRVPQRQWYKAREVEELWEVDGWEIEHGWIPNKQKSFLPLVVSLLVSLSDFIIFILGVMLSLLTGMRLRMHMRPHFNKLLSRRFILRDLTN